MPGDLDSADLRIYEFNGLRLATDLSFDNLVPTPSPNASITLLARSLPFPDPGIILREFVEIQTGSVFFRLSEGAQGIQYWNSSVGLFWIEATGDRVWYNLADGADRGDIEHLVASHVISFALQLQGRVLLHASSVAIDGKAVAFSAPSGTGKSTIAAAFGRRGFEVLSDDIVPIYQLENEVFTNSYLQSIRLWDDSISALGEDPREHDLVLSNFEKRRFNAGSRWGSLVANAYRIHSIYLLRPAPAAEGTGFEVSFEDVRDTKRVIELMGCMYMRSTLRGSRAASAFRLLPLVTQAVRTRYARYPLSYDSADRLIDAVIADVSES